MGTAATFRVPEALAEQHSFGMRRGGDRRSCERRRPSAVPETLAEQHGRTSTAARLGATEQTRRACWEQLSG